MNYLNERYPKNSWSIKFRKLLGDSLEVKKKWNFGNEKYHIERTTIIQRLEHLTEDPPDKKHKEPYTFYKRMCRERQHLFTFLYFEYVPPDNNASERAICNVKLKQKISGQFKAEKTVQNFAQIRSVKDTTIKNGLNVSQALAIVAKFEFDLQTD